MFGDHELPVAQCKLSTMEATTRRDSETLDEVRSERPHGVALFRVDRGAMAGTLAHATARVPVSETLHSICSPKALLESRGVPAQAPVKH